MHTCVRTGPGKLLSSHYLSVLVISSGVTVYSSQYQAEQLPHVKAGHPFIFHLPPTVVRGDVKVPLPLIPTYIHAFPRVPNHANAM